MGRHRHLTTYDLYRLDLAVAPLRRAFAGCRPGGTYLVGSVERGEVYRDVDVRTILPDADFDALFGGSQSLWEVFCLGVTAWMREQTGLPIDYQVQRLTEANEQHSGPRNSLSGGARQFAGGGDATRFLASIDEPLPPKTDATIVDQPSSGDGDKIAAPAAENDPYQR